jgi:hypothetical protein
MPNITQFICLLISAKAKISGVTSGDLGSEYNVYQRQSKKSDASVYLTTKDDREFLQSIAKSRDEMNRGMSRKEMIVLISELFGASYKAAENHFDYLILTKQLNDLKHGGRVIAALQSPPRNCSVHTTLLCLRIL